MSLNYVFIIHIPFQSNILRLGLTYLLPTFMHAGEDVVFIANDWHTALLPCYLKSMYKPKGIYKSARVGTLFACLVN